MPIRYKKRSRHFRGSRHNGYGIQGQHRKKGLKGGFGKTGLGKHKWTWTVIHKPNYFGKHGFKRPQKIIEEVNIINIKDVEEKLPTWEEEEPGAINKKGTYYEIDLDTLGYQKLLSTGRVNGKYNIKVKKASKRAVEKISDAGGEVELLADASD